MGAWDLNPGLHDVRHRWNHGAMAATRELPLNFFIALKQAMMPPTFTIVLLVITLAIFILCFCCRKCGNSQPNEDQHQFNQCQPCQHQCNHHQQDQHQCTHGQQHQHCNVNHGQHEQQREQNYTSSVYSIKMPELDDPPSYESVVADQGRIS